MFIGVCDNNLTIEVKVGNEFLSEVSNHLYGNTFSVRFDTLLSDMNVFDNIKLTIITLAREVVGYDLNEQNYNMIVEPTKDGVKFIFKVVAKDASVSYAEECQYLFELSTREPSVQTRSYVELYKAIACFKHHYRGFSKNTFTVTDEVCAVPEELQTLTEEVHPIHTVKNYVIQDIEHVYLLLPIIKSTVEHVKLYINDTTGDYVLSVYYTGNESFIMKDCETVPNIDNTLRLLTDDAYQLLK